MIYVSASVVLGMQGNKTSVVPNEKGYICKQIFHLTAAENFDGNSVGESIHHYLFIHSTDLLYHKVKPCPPVPPVSRV